MAPRAGFEPATNRLTAGCSTTELPRNSALNWPYSKAFNILPSPTAIKTCQSPNPGSLVVDDLPADFLEASPGIEPGCKDLQSSA